MPASSTTVGPSESAPRTCRCIWRPSIWTSNPGAGYRRRSRTVSTCWTAAAEPIVVAASSAALPHRTGYPIGRVIGDGINAEHVPVPRVELDEESVDQVVAGAHESMFCAGCAGR